MIDDIDRTLMMILQQDARTSNADIARQVGMAPSAILERIRKLEARGLIQGCYLMPSYGRYDLVGELARELLRTSAGAQTHG